MMSCNLQHFGQP